MLDVPPLREYGRMLSEGVECSPGDILVEH